MNYWDKKIVREQLNSKSHNNEDTKQDRLTDTVLHALGMFLRLFGGGRQEEADRRTSCTEWAAFPPGTAAPRQVRHDAPGKRQASRLAEEATENTGRKPGWAPRRVLRDAR